MTFRLLFLAVFFLALSARGADVYDRYIAVLGVREAHDELVLKRFEPVIADLDAHGLLPRDPQRRAEKLAELRKIILDALGFENMRIEYRLRIEKMFSRKDMEAAIADLESPAVATILKRQGRELGEQVSASSFAASREKFEKVLRQMRACLRDLNS